MDFDKFAKIVADRAESLKLPKEVEDKRKFFDKIFDLIKRRGNIESILRNAYEKDFEDDENKKSKEIFAKILETGEYIGDDEIQYLLMQILLSYENLEPKDSTVSLEPTVDDEETELTYKIPITVDFTKHIENVQNIIEDFLSRYRSDDDLSSIDDTLKDPLSIPVKYLKDKKKYTYDPYSQQARQVSNKMFTYMYEQLNYFRDVEENQTKEKLKVYFNKQFNDYFKDDSNRLESIKLSHTLANDGVSFLQEVRRAELSGQFTVVEKKGHFKFLENDMIRRLVSQNIPAKIDTKDFSEEEANTAKEVENTLENILELTLKNLYRSEQTISEGRFFGNIENTFKEKLALKLYSIISSNEKYKAAYKITNNEDKAIKKIAKAIGGAFNSTTVTSENKEQLMKFYKLQVKKFFKPKLYGKTISSLARYYLKQKELDHKPDREQNVSDVKNEIIRKAREKLITQKETEKRKTAGKNNLPPDYFYFIDAVERTLEWYTRVQGPDARDDSDKWMEYMDKKKSKYALVFYSTREGGKEQYYENSYEEMLSKMDGPPDLSPDPVEEQIANKLKPLIREKLKRKING